MVVERPVIKLQMMSNYENDRRYLIFMVPELQYMHVMWTLSDETMKLADC